MIFLAFAGVLFVALIVIGIVAEVQYARYQRRMLELLGPRDPRTGFRSRAETTTPRERSVVDRGSSPRGPA